MARRNDGQRLSLDEDVELLLVDAPRTVGTAALTDDEAEVATLVADGRSIEQVAELRETTVAEGEAVLRRVMAKLGAERPGDIAAILFG